MKTNSSQQTMLEAALSYAKMGFKVLPLCHPTPNGKCGCGKGHTGKQIGKAPLIKDWVNKATREVLRVLALWDKHPDANIGILTDELVVLDFDKDKGGLDSKAAIEAKYGPLPRTRAHRTGGGGEHWIYSNPDGTDIRSAVKLGGYKGMDLRANGGQIVAPPSLHRNGNRYEVIDGTEITPAPEWLMKMVTEITPAPKAKPGELIPEGQRNSTLTRLAGSMRRPGMTSEEIFAALMEVNRLRCQPPLSDEEVHRIAESVSRYEPQTDEYVPLRSMADVQPKAVDWLWHPYIPLGKLTLLEGDPGEGKSWASLAIATKVSLGELGQEPGNTLLASVEDDLDDTIRPRLDALGADLSRIHPIETSFILDDKGFALVKTYVEEYHPTLFIIDPLTGFVGDKVDIHRANEVRTFMAKLTAMARDYRFAVLLIRHLNKGGSSKALYRGLGSIDFIAAARSVLLAGHVGDDLSERALVHIKCNNAPLGPSVGFMLGDIFCWTGQSLLTAKGILAESGEKSQKMEEAIDFIKGSMKGSEQVLASGIFQAAKDEGITEKTLKKAKSKLRIKSSKRGGVWYWYLGEEKAEGKGAT